MTNTKHTPGPWTTQECDGQIDINSSHGVIAICNNSDLSSQQANARLIAAAPDLISELEESNADLIDCIDALEKHLSEDVLQGLWKQVERNRATIAKARGE